MTAQPKMLLVRRLADTAPEGMDIEYARRQWRSYVDTFGEHGWLIIEAEPLPEHPRGVFVGELLTAVGAHALCPPSAPEGRGAELRTLTTTARGVGLSIERIVGAIGAADIVDAGRTVYIGRPPESDERDFDEVAAVLTRWRRTPRGIALPAGVRLSTVLSVLPDGTLLGDPEVVGKSFAPDGFVAAPEPEGACVVGLDNRDVIVSAKAPRTVELLRQRGLRVMPLPMAEFERFGGTIASLSVRSGEEGGHRTLSSFARRPLEWATGSVPLRR